MVGQCPGPASSLRLVLRSSYGRGDDAACEQGPAEPRWLLALVVIGGAIVIAASPVHGEPAVALGSPVLHRAELFVVGLVLG